MNNEWPADWNADEEFDDADLAILDSQTTRNEAKPAAQQTFDGDVDYDGFDAAAGHNWLYPNNLPLRTYQHNIVQAALYRNTLVVLPTGLGKTFIAAVVMYNLHRWYPKGKLIFMAPTRPLVSQQIAACQKIMPFPAEDTVELTGRLQRVKRLELWRSKRVFFATPQVVQSDIVEAEFPFQQIKLLVIDEAHRAKGRYAYTQVTESLMARNRNFRVLALSATPGRHVEDVAAVCRNLYISHLEVRCDNSIDVQPYTHKRQLRTIVVSLKDNIKEPRARLLQLIDPYLRQLIQADVLKARANLSRAALLHERTRYQERAANGQRHPEHSLVVSNFAMCISMYYALELLERHGLRVFVNSFEQEDKFVLRDNALRELVEQVRAQLGANPFDISTRPMTNGQIAPMPAKLDFGHPKYEQAREVIVQHFEQHSETRAIVFCEYRESVMLIQRLLLQHRPLVRSRCFVGQSANGGGICALTQKEQIQIMNDFRSGVLNLLVATSIGEEGLDVGEVDFIVCFDICSSNPTRFVQRIGRTGRQKKGEVVMLVTEGREQQLLKDVLATKEQTNRKLLQSTVIKAALYEQAPRLVPPQFQPKCEQRFMESTKPVIKSPSPKKQKLPKDCQDLRKYFKQSEERFLKNTPSYEVGAASQLLLQKELQRRSAGVQNFLVETQTTEADNSQQRLRQLLRLLQSNKPLVAESQRSQDLLCQLQDKQLPLALKRVLLQHNAKFVAETQQKMLQQQQLQLDAARLNTRQQRTRRNYELLLEICQGEQALEQLLSAQSSAEPQQQQQQQFAANCELIFKGLKPQDVCNDNYELLQQQLVQLEQRQLERTLREQAVDTDSELEHSWEQPDEQSAWQQYEEQHFEPIASASSTPLQVKCTPNVELSTNLSRLNCLMLEASTPKCKPKQEAQAVTPELDLDLNDFLEPLPEEQLLQLSACKENQAGMSTPRNRSPDLFAEDCSLSPWQPAKPKSLAAKLSAKLPVNKTPERIKAATQQQQQRSPSIFESYLQRMRGRGKLSKEAQQLHELTSNAQQEDSPLLRPKRTAKRKICDVSAEEQLSDELDYEQVPATQLLELTPPKWPRQRRPKPRNAFILDEADQSGSDHEEAADAENTIGCYLHDSVVVSSDEDQHNDTNMHAIYLQGIRSPIKRAGAFKILEPRTYDVSQIYSQAVEAEPSQYLPCSFIADEESALLEQAHDISECPLERAERILKEQRRQRKRDKAEGATQPKRRRIQTIVDSSDDDDDIIMLD
ncbi:CG7922 [Drosophila busckii]|uniref:CG7922 n=1 Tax=Drosophila busckii TaxID=30019 RepID=A0A0M4EUJ9_DROBS|nr:ATP-dependent DNA helicase MPH1 [Drosophila busckii]ALC41120.1 CG7922 [Drosophila busckii]